MKLISRLETSVKTPAHQGRKRLGFSIIAARELYLACMLLVLSTISLQAKTPDASQRPENESDSIYLPLKPMESRGAATSFPIELTLDDGSAEGVFGIGGATAQQFLWFNRFSLGAPFDLRQIEVLFAPGPNITLNAPIDLVIYHDTDGDPTNGATWLATYAREIEALDGFHFSTYAIEPPLQTPTGGDLLIGVIPRFIDHDISPSTAAAALDTTSNLGDSWIGVWTGPPPSPPTLPSDLFMGQIDIFVPGGGNWMIRAAGGATPVVDIPALSPSALALMALILITAGVAIRTGYLERLG